MQQLKLYKQAKWYLDWLKGQGITGQDNKLYTCLGEFSHAPGHYLMCEFGTWKLSGMHELSNFEEVKEHPDDLVINIDT